MKTMATGCLAGLVILTGVSTSVANEFEAALQELAKNRVQALVSDPAIVAAVQAQNQQHAGMAEDQIIALDKSWRAEVGAASTPTIDPVLNGVVADMLRAMRDESEGLFTEIFVMDNLGLNVAASDTTSDYWQGDEAKWQQTYSVGPDALHISEIEFDDSTGFYQSQASLSITDPATGAVIGAVTFGINVQNLM